MTVPGTRTVYLHIGTYKTATTFLQHVLYHNFKDPSGPVYYPRVGIFGTAHHYLATPDFPGWTNGVTPAEYENVWGQLLKDLDQCHADGVILSSEMFCSLSGAAVRYVREALKAYTVRAIIYFRRQDQYISSLAAQMVKGCNGKPGDYTSLNRAIETIRTSRQFDYGNMCKQWAQVIGEENLVVRPFERSQLYREDVLADFFHHLAGMPVPGAVTLPPGNLNPRLCRDALEFKQLVNRLPVDRETMNATLPGLFAYSETMDARTRSTYQEHVLLSPSQRTEILRFYEDINAHIARTYLKREDGVLFEAPLTDPENEWKPYPGLDIHTMEAMIQILEKTTPGIVELLKRGALNADIADDDGMRRFVNMLTGKSNQNPSWKRIMPDFLLKRLVKLAGSRHRNKIH